MEAGEAGAMEGGPPQGGQQQQQGDDAVRFEDLTVDDDLPILERIVRYTRSQIALQRLVHVKMLGETAELAGMLDTQEVLVPSLQMLVADGESVIRQHLAAQLLSIAVVCMIEPSSAAAAAAAFGDDNPNNEEDAWIQVEKWLDHPEWPKTYDVTGYKLVMEHIVRYLTTLLVDLDVDVRRAAADALTRLSMHIHPSDIPTYLVPIPLKLVADNAAPKNAAAQPRRKSKDGQVSEAQIAEDLRMTAANVLAELGGAVSEQAHLREQNWATETVLPAVIQLSQDPSFRVRRAAAQALPRILAACTVSAVLEEIIPAFVRLSKDELYRVRKSTGECLVDMSRAITILAGFEEDDSDKLHEVRRTVLIPIADRLIQDEHKMVRQGMMQFLGPFMASFYPYHQTKQLVDVLPAVSESDGSHHSGIVAQFFPHATSMVSRLNSSQQTVTTAPTPVLVDPVLEDTRLEIEKLTSILPTFIQASRQSQQALDAVKEHRKANPPDPKDIEALIQGGLLDYFAALAIVLTGDENTDAEMRVYCAYSFPAVVLLLGPENWPGSLKTCFFTLLNPSFANTDEDDRDGDGGDGVDPQVEPPLPVKRCLASSLHTVAQILGTDIAGTDILPIVLDYFMRDSDEAVRLNLIRGFPALLDVLPVEQRGNLFTQWAAVMLGEDCLGVHGKKKRSATNPMVLNWRQRDSLARSLPDIVPLVSPELLHASVWPMLQALICDAISLVREDALWCIPCLLQSFTPENLTEWEVSGDAKKVSQKWCNEVVNWFEKNILKIPKKGSNQANGGDKDKDKTPPVPNFTDRQLYCRATGAIALTLRLHEEIKATAKMDLGESVVQLLFGGRDVDANHKPYQKLSNAENKHLRKLMEDHFLPTALKLKDDHIRNVRVVLLRVLQILPVDMREGSSVAPILKTLTEETQTWESFGEEDGTGGSTMGSASAVSSNGGTIVATKKETEATAAAAVSKKTKKREKDKKERGREKTRTGPVDVDEVSLTPTNSRDEDDEPPESGDPEGEDDEDEDEEEGGKKSKGKKSKDKGKKEKKGKEKKKKKGKKKGETSESDDSDDSDSDDSYEKALKDAVREKKASGDDEDDDGDNDGDGSGEDDETEEAEKKRKTPARTKSLPKSKEKKGGVKRTKSGKGDKKKGVESIAEDEEDDSKSKKKGDDGDGASDDEEDGHLDAFEKEAGWKTVMFEDGPIGLQLEPILEDSACRVYGFLETGDAKKSGKISLGDVIVKVNGVVVHSYDETVTLLKKGGRRAVAFRPGEVTDDYNVDDEIGEDGEEDEEEEHEEEVKVKKKKKDKGKDKDGKDKEKKVKKTKKKK